MLPCPTRILARFFRIGACKKMLERDLESAAVFLPQRSLRFTAHNKYHRSAIRLKMTCARSHVDGSHASGKDRADDDAGHDVLLRFQERLDHAVHRRAARHATR